MKDTANSAASAATGITLTIASYQEYINAATGLCGIILTLVMIWYWIRKGILEKKRADAEILTIHTIAAGSDRRKPKTTEEILAEILENKELLDMLRKKLNHD